MDIGVPAESKALRLARYLREFVKLRTTTVQDVDKYEAVLWFGDMPNESDCLSPAWNDGLEAGGPWLEVRKQQFPKLPEPPKNVVPWLNQQALRQATEEMPPLHRTIHEPDLTAERGEGEEAPLVERQLDDHPEVVKAYEGFRPTWTAWSNEYRRRSRIQAIYAELFRLHTQLQKQGEIVELVLGVGLLSWPTKPSIRRHVFAVGVDLQFNAASGVITLAGDSSGARLRIEDDMLDARPDRSHYESVSAQLDAIGDEIWDRAHLFTALNSWVGAIHADAEWSPELRPSVGLPNRPAISFSPALILRRRTQAGMIRVYDSIIRQLADNDGDVPNGWISLVEDGDDQDHADEMPPSEGDSTRAAATEEVYFPLASNREQRRIVEAIGQRRGVLVQGPPGTGKSHTIANLMCHLLATGKKVLITAETSRALKVLKDKLPEEIQPLCISLLGQGGDSFAELNAAVQGITTRYASWRPSAYDQQITEIDRDLNAKRRELAKLDAELRGLREDETVQRSLVNGAYQGSASSIAAKVASERDRFGWLQIPKDAADDAPLTSEALATWLFIRRTYGDEAIEDATLRIVETKQLATPVDFGTTVAAERDAIAALDRLVSLRRHPAYAPIMTLKAEDREKLADAIRDLGDRRKKLFRHNYEWLVDGVRASMSGRPARLHALAKQSQEIIDQIDRFLHELGTTTVSIPENRNPEAVRSDAAALLQHLESGGGWTKWYFIEPKVVKERTYLREQVIVGGQPADNPARLQLVCRHLDMVIAFRSLEETWADHGGLPDGSSPRIRLAAVKEHVAILTEALAYAQLCTEVGRRMASAMPAIPEPDWMGEEPDNWLEIIEASTVEERHRLAEQKVTGCLRSLTAVHDLHDAHPVVKTLTQAIKGRDVSAYSKAYEQTEKIEKIRESQKVREATERVLRSAVPGLLEGIERSIVDQAWDERVAEWPLAWRWAVAENWLRKRTDFNYQRQLLARRHATDKEICELLAKSAALHAWKHFFGRLSPQQAAALKSWREAVRAIGKGTGRSARIERLRKEARQYMSECREAIPVWIMPRYLVAEMIDPASSRYDLVIVDEASQLGAESLFLFYIAKRMIVVGDDQQISPAGVGIADQDVSDLQQHYLSGIPHQHALSVQSSLYANAKIRFGENIVLREHFRCMPEIIQFSNDLCYASNGTPLDPLRAYTANRLVPLVRRHIAEGFRAGSSQQAINEPEADAIVNQIVSCIEDPQYAGKTMGVISLQGEAQAKLIERKLLETLEPECIEERQLICGDAYAFQGDERHIMFLSMVAAAGEGRIGVLANEAARQRFNVAASRAQDQMWLFHSATLDVLSPACMRHHLLGYMLNPVRRTIEEGQQRFDSQFERHVLQLIQDRGFHVRTQVCIGDPTNHRYRIDLVVEGMQGRLAVECDGDQWHGPDRYEHDMARQRDLERAGWQFVRIRGGEFYRDQSKAMEPLWAELDRLGIRPGGIDESAGEPPPPAERQKLKDNEAEELIREDATSEERDPTEDDAVTEEPSVTVENITTNDTRPNPAPVDHLLRDAAPNLASDISQEPSVSSDASEDFLRKYVVYAGPSEPDPRTVSTGVVADGLVRIIDCEGPMIAKRAYDIYLRGCGIRRLGGELKSTMNKALTVAIRQGRIISVNEVGKSGVIFSTVFSKGRPAVHLRTRGPRTFEEIPPGELRAVSEYILSRSDLAPGSDAHLRAILECYDLKRLTTQVGATLLDILQASAR